MNKLMTHQQPPRRDASESWDDDFEFQSKPPSPSDERPPATPSRSNTAVPVPLPAPHEESWDDVYEDEDTHQNAHPAPASHTDGDADMASWGSTSEWSGDGDAEDHSQSQSQSHESYIRGSSEPPGRHSSSSASHEARFPTLSHATFLPHATSPSPTSPSFFARMSTKKWKAKPKPPHGKKKETETHDPAQFGTMKSTRWPKRKEPATPSSPEHKPPSPLKRVFSGAHLAASPLRPSKRYLQPRARPPAAQSPPTPDLTFSPSSPASTAPTSPATSPAPAQSTALCIPSPSLPLVSLSTHALPLSPPAPSGRPDRRASLGDLKLRIPERIERAQRDIRRDMGDVRKFAACVERLRSLQSAYATLVRDIPAAAAPSRPRRPSFSPKKRRGTTSTSTSTSASSPQSSPTKPHTTRRFTLSPCPSPSSPLTALETHYALDWEYAALLIELGSADADAGARPRAVTLGSGSGSGTGPADESDEDAGMGVGRARPATTGRVGGGAMTARQVVLLRGVLEGGGVRRRGGEGRMEGGEEAKGKEEKEKERTTRGIRELWRGIRRGGGGDGGGDSSASDGPGPGSGSVHASVAGAGSRRKTPSRRPSLAGIFGLGVRAAGKEGGAEEGGERGGTIRAKRAHAPAAGPSFPPCPAPLRLTLTPENIRPLLRHARGVVVRLEECVGEARGIVMVRAE